MKILVLYGASREPLRKTVQDHVLSFSRYVKDVDFHYFPVHKHVPSYLKMVQYDGIIVHYSMLARREPIWIWRELFLSLKTLSRMKAVKVVMPQDEYVYTRELCLLFKHCGFNTLYTTATEDDWDIIYPKEQHDLKHLFTTLTGFVDEASLDRIEQLRPQIPRTIDIGYRARELPYWLGHHGQIKCQVGYAFQAVQGQTTLKMDISMDDRQVFYGDAWTRFLLQCRTMIGTLGGASLHDPDGLIKGRVDRYLLKNPKASFDEVRSHCFDGLDDSIKIHALSPRHFECAMTRTCQVLVEGDYKMFSPGVHYIELKRDYSNMGDVLEQIADHKHCESIAERAYEDIVASGKHTYRRFANEVIDHIRHVSMNYDPSKPRSRSKFGFSVLGSFLAARAWLLERYLAYRRARLKLRAKS